MTAAAATPATEASLPQLAGGLLWIYRLIWALLAGGACAALLAAPFDPAMHPLIVALRLVKGAAVITVAAILLRRRQRDPVAALLALAFLAWTITSSFDFASNAVVPMLLDRFRFILFALALLLFPDGEWRPEWTRKVAAASVPVFLLGVAEAVGLLPTKAFLPPAILCVVSAVGSLIARFRAAPSEAVRQQLRWVALGLVPGVGLILSARFGAAFGSGGPHAMQLSIAWEAMFQLGIVTIALGFLVSLLRYRLYDAETVISRSAAYAALTLGVLTCFAATEGFIEGLGQHYLGSGIGDFSAVFAASVAALLFTPLHRRIELWAEHHFQHDLVRLKQDLPELANELSASCSTRQFAAAVLPPINIAIHATHSALIVGGRLIGCCGVQPSVVRRWASALPAATAPEFGHDSGDKLFPVRLPLNRSSTGSECWLLIGPRPDGTLYPRDEGDALEAILPALHRGITTTLAREKRNSETRRFKRRLGRCLAGLQSRIGMLEDELRRQRIICSAS
jgi:hypothetical protein